MKSAQYWIEHLQMIPHPEGGYYLRPHISTESFIRKDIPGVYTSERKLWTSEYMLIEAMQKQSFHRVRSDEMWYYHAGAPLKVHVIDQDGHYQQAVLGLDISENQRPQYHIPKNSIVALEGDLDLYSLIGVMISPGFDMDDFTLFSRDELVARHPQHKELIEQFTEVY